MCKLGGGPFRCPHDPLLHALRMRRSRAEKRDDFDAVAELIPEVATRRAEVAVDFGLEPLRDGDPWETREVKLSHHAHAAIYIHLNDRVDLDEDEREKARQIHSRYERVRVAAMRDPDLHPGVIRLAMRDADPAISNAAYDAASRQPGLFRSELARTGAERSSARLGLDTPPEELLAWQQEYRQVAYRDAEREAIYGEGGKSAKTPRLTADQALAQAQAARAAEVEAELAKEAAARKPRTAPSKPKRGSKRSKTTRRAKKR